MDGKLYDELRRKLLERVEFDSTRMAEMQAFAAELVRHINASVNKTWNVCELGSDDDGTFTLIASKSQNRNTLPFSLALTFANKDGTNGRSYGPEMRFVVPFLLECTGDSFKLTCLKTQAAIDFTVNEFREPKVLAEASALLDTAVTDTVRKYIDPQ